jgi:spore coat protein U-like protein
MRCLIASLLLMAPAVLPAVDKTATIGLNVEVLPACQAGSSSGSGVSFGTLDFGTHLRLDNLITQVGQPDAGALRVNCQQNIPYRVLINAGHSGTTSNRQMVGPGSAVLSYNLYTGADYTTVWDNSTGSAPLAMARISGLRSTPGCQHRMFRPREATAIP